MTELGTSLKNAAAASFTRRMMNDSKVRQIAYKARDSTSYEVANQYAVRVGELMSETLTGTVGDLAYLSEEVAGELLVPALTTDHQLVAEVAKQIQENINSSNGLGIEALAADLDMDRINGLVKKISEGTLQEGKWLLGEPIVNFSQSVSDWTIRKNADANAKIGLQPKIVRKAEASGFRQIRRGKRTYSYKVPCKWCAGLAGTYNYADVKATGSDVYRRHENCRCEITYVQGTRRQDAWSKVEWTGDDAEAKAEAVQQSLAEKVRQEMEKQKRMQTRRSMVDQVMLELGYSPKGASIWVNQHKDYILKYGLDYMIEASRNNPARYFS